MFSLYPKGVAANTRFTPATTGPDVIDRFRGNPMAGIAVALDLVAVYSDGTAGDFR